MRHERGLLGATRVVEDLRVPCEAGVPIGETLEGSGVYCRITDSTILSATDPSSLEVCCLSERGCRECPVWKHDKRETFRRQGRVDLAGDLA